MFSSLKNPSISIFNTFQSVRSITFYTARMRQAIIASVRRQRCSGVKVDPTSGHHNLATASDVAPEHIACCGPCCGREVGKALGLHGDDSGYFKDGLTAEGLNDSLTHPLLPQLQAIFDRVLPREPTA